MLKHATILAVSAFALLAAGPIAAQDAEPVADVTRDTVVATVDGVEITVGHMIITTAQLPQQYQAMPPDVLFPLVMDQLIQQQVLAATLETDPGRVRIALENERRSLLTGEVINALVEAAATDEAVQAAYDAAFVGMEPVTEYNASHILVPTEEEAIALKARLDGGEAFADLAREASGDASGANGGELGWFGPGMMVEEFFDAVITLEAGQFSDPVETQFGWHLIALNETRIQAVPTLEEVREEIVGQVQQAAIAARLEELTTAATITRPAEGAFDPAVIIDLEMLRD